TFIPVSVSGGSHRGADDDPCFPVTSTSILMTNSETLLNGSARSFARTHLNQLARWTAVACLLPAALLTAQPREDENAGAAAPGRLEDDVHTLTPFSVRSSGDVGYGSGTEGASGRLRVPYLDAA